MLALQQPPSAKTDREFFAGRHGLAQQFDGDDRGFKTVLRNAKQRGYKPSDSDIYESGLARFPGDPQAFIPSTEGRGYAKKLLEKRGWRCEDFGLKGRQEAPKQVALANDLADKLLAKTDDKKLKQQPKAVQRAEMARRHGFKRRSRA